MNIDVYDSFSKTPEGKIIHFDVFVKTGTSKNDTYEYGRKWLQHATQGTSELEIAKCNFCHSKKIDSKIIAEIEKFGFFILKLEGCPI